MQLHIYTRFVQLYEFVTMHMPNYSYINMWIRQGFTEVISSLRKLKHTL